MTTPATEQSVVTGGIYHIIVAFGPEVIDGHRLTHGEYVTITPPSAQPDPKQEWRILRSENNNIFIERPSQFFPGTYLTYQVAPKKPEAGDRIVLKVSEFPLTEWRRDIAPGFTSFIRVAGSDLGIALGDLDIEPPFLGLSNKDLQWNFQRVRDE